MDSKSQKGDYIIYGLDADEKQVYCSKVSTTARGIKTLFGRFGNIVFGCAFRNEVGDIVKSAGYRHLGSNEYTSQLYNGEVDLIGYKDYLKANRKPRETGKKRVVFYSDPAHAWLKVSVKELVKLGIADKITHLSYVRGKHAFLEEDCDAALYLDTLKALHGGKLEFKVEEHSTNKQSRIRGYRSYTPGYASAFAD